jgi:hypothetical protein
MISQYWVDQIPSRPLPIVVKDGNGVEADLTSYDQIKVRMLGSRNEEIDLSGATINTNQAVEGKIFLIWPTNKTLFEYKGDYVLQVELISSTAKDITSSHTIRVRELGRTQK